MDRKNRVHLEEFTNCLRIAIVPDDMQDERIQEIKNYCLQYGFSNVMLFFNAEEFNQGHITKEELLPWLQTIKKAKIVFEECGLSVSLNPWIEMGHLDRGRKCKDGQNFTTMVDMYGKTSSLVACPWDEEWRKYYFNLLGWYLQEINPDFLWIEDDFRLHNHAPLTYGGCFCKLHVKKMNEKLGTDYTREELVEKIFAKGGLNKERKAWLDVNRETILDISEKIGIFVERLGLKTRIGLMSSAPWMHCMEARDWSSLHKNLSAGQEKVNRIHLPCYEEMCGKTYGRMFNAVSMVIRTFIPQDTIVYPELENGAFSNFVKDGRFLQFQLESSIPLLPSGMTYDIYDFVGNGVIPEYGYGEAVASVTPYLQGIMDLGLRFEDLEGVRIPVDEKTVYHRSVEKDWTDLLNQDACEALGYVNGLGINCKATQQKNIKDEMVFLTGDSVCDFSDGECVALFKNNFIIADGGCVLALQKRGLAHLLAVKSAGIYTPDAGFQSYEQASQILLVNGKRKYRASCQEKAGDYVKIEYTQDMLAYSHTYTPDRTRFGLGIVESKNFAVIPYILKGMLLEQYNPLRREILYAILKKHQKNYVQTGVSAVQPYLYKSGNAFVLMLVNYTVGTLDKICFSTNIDFSSLCAIDRSGKKQKVAFIKTGDKITVDMPLCYLSTATLILE